MIHTKYVATKDLLEAIIYAKRAFGRHEGEDASSQPAPASREEVAPASVREGFDGCDGG